MATEFPHCDIVSVDVAPVTSHIPRSNISFEVYDLYSGIAEPNESFDYVSCRHIQLHVGLFHLKYQAIKINLCEFLTQVKEYDRLIFDLHRVLKPGGLVTICEVENNIFEVDQPPYDTIAYRTAPSMLRGLDAMRTAVTYQGIDIDAIYRLDEWLQPDSTFWAETAEKYEYVLNYISPSDTLNNFKNSFVKDSRASEMDSVERFSRHTKGSCAYSHRSMAPRPRSSAGWGPCCSDIFPLL